MVIGERLRALREGKKFSQGDIEKRTGLLRCYISRVENGHTVPAVETLEKFARALEVPMYSLFYDGAEPPKKIGLQSDDNAGWGSRGSDAELLNRFRRLFQRTNPRDLKLILFTAQKIAQQRDRENAAE
jgi:transcriptional regulator with XRE-family HTH domain